MSEHVKENNHVLSKYFLLPILACSHMRTNVFLVFALIEGAVKAKKLKSTGCASKKIKEDQNKS